jgi:hypothetical protein
MTINSIQFLFIIKLLVEKERQLLLEERRYKIWKKLELKIPSTFAKESTNDTQTNG